MEDSHNTNSGALEALHRQPDRPRIYNSQQFAQAIQETCRLLHRLDDFAALEPFLFSTHAHRRDDGMLVEKAPEFPFMEQEKPFSAKQRFSPILNDHPRLAVDLKLWYETVYGVTSQLLRASGDEQGSDKGSDRDARANASHAKGMSEQAEEFKCWNGIRRIMKVLPEVTRKIENTISTEHTPAEQDKKLLNALHALCRIQNTYIPLDDAKEAPAVLVVLSSPPKSPFLEPQKRSV